MASRTNDHSSSSGAGGSRASEKREHTPYEQVESETARALDDLVSKPSFGRLLAMVGENVAAISRITSDAADLTLRNLRVAGRADITRLARQLHRTEDKLERVLQEVEGLRDQIASQRAAEGDAGRDAVKQP
jgi:hypothetical protein